MAVNDAPAVFIGGQRRPTGATFEVIDPATEQAFAEAPQCTKHDLDEAFDAAQRAQPSWGADENARREALGKVADALLAAEEYIAQTLTREQGKALQDARLEVQSAARWYRYHCMLELPAQESMTPDSTKVVMHSPLGVVAAITPWNFPITLSAWKLAPALRAGNTVVLKPSPYTPLATLIMGEVLNSVLPAGVVNTVSGGDLLGKQMTSHPVPRKVSFTGSTRGGMAVAASAAADLKRITLELGGNDASIILDDADPEKAATAIFWSAFYNNGQVCGAVKRLYVHQSQYRAVVDILAKIADGVKVGNGLSADTVLGPINNRVQFERVIDLFEDAVANGAQVASGGTRPAERGYFFRPTILSGVDDGCRVVKEEQFGPILPVLSYNDLDDAITRANTSKFALGASVWGTDPTRLAQVAKQLYAGSVWVNAHAKVGPEDPFGGARWSGIGVEGGIEGIRAFQQMHVIHYLDPVVAAAA